MLLSGLSAGLQTKGSLVLFPVRAHAWFVGQVPCGRPTRGNHILLFPSLSPSFPLSLKINKILQHTENIFFADLTKIGIILIHSHQMAIAVLAVVTFYLTI